MGLRKLSSRITAALIGMAVVLPAIANQIDPAAALPPDFTAVNEKIFRIGSRYKIPNLQTKIISRMVDSAVFQMIHGITLKRMMRISGITVQCRFAK